MRRFLLRFMLGAFVLLAAYELVQIAGVGSGGPDEEAEEVWWFAAQTVAEVTRALAADPQPVDAAALQQALGVAVTPLSEAEWAAARQQASSAVEHRGVHLLLHEPTWEDEGAMVARLPMGPVRIDAWRLAMEADHAMRGSHWLSLLVLIGGMAGLGLALVAPPARHLRQIAQTAQALEGGDLTARAAVPAGSLAAPVARALNDMSAQIQRVVEWQELMLQTVAHELRTPLARVRFVVARLADAADADARAEALADLDDDLTELEALVSSVLTLVRADPRAGLHLEAVALDPLLRDAVGRLRLPDGGAGHPVTVEPLELGDGPVQARMDRAAASRVFDNLLRNATAHARSRVRVRVEQEPDAIVVAVEDDGAGLPETQQGRIFEPFVRLDDARAQAGTGLGLAIVKRLVEAHGHGVRVRQSALGGLRVETRWPRVVGPPE